MTTMDGRAASSSELYGFPWPELVIDQSLGIVSSRFQNVVARAHPSHQAAIHAVTWARSTAIQARRTCLRQALCRYVVTCLQGRIAKCFQRRACQKKEKFATLVRKWPPKNPEKMRV
jgi:hypothetical protein